jgi:hypothetical protein
MLVWLDSMKRLSLFVEELVGKSWLRRPVDRNVGDISAELEKRRADAFKGTVHEFESSADELKHVIETAEDIDSLYAAMEQFNCDAYDIAADATEFEQATERDDLEAARTQLLMGIEKWIDRSITAADQNGQDTFSLQGHPMRRVKGGGPSLKRSMGY